MRAPAEQTDAGRSNLAKRVASAAILAPLGLAALFVGGPLWDVVIALAAGAAAYEWAGICNRTGARPWLVGLCAGVTLLGAATSVWPAFVLLAVGMAFLLAVPAAGPAMSCGAAYVALPSLALVWLRGEPEGAAASLLVMLTVWSSDTGAYVAGRAFGGPKLAPSISPAKTWSGAVGGLLAACALGAAFAVLVPRHLLPLPLSVAAGAVAGGLLGVSAQAGDLVESAAKRHFGVKDSGRLIPGHGGLLDRVDGLMAAAPAAALLLIASHGSMPS